MSNAAIAQFFEQLKTDRALLSEYHSEVAEAMRTSVWPAMVRIAAAHGYDFTEEELAGFLKSGSEELSDQELESIAAAGPVGTVGTLGTNPWALAQIVATAIAIPEAIHDGDEERDPG